MYVIGRGKNYSANNCHTNILCKGESFTLLSCQVYIVFYQVYKKKPPDPELTCSSPAPSATISTMTFPKATVRSHPACSTDFILVGA